MGMRISIIVPVLNDKRVSRAIQYIITQKFDGELELIVIDGGSTDGTLDILELYRNNISIFVSEPDRGIYDAMNKGIHLASGDIIGILNADDIYADSHVLQDILKAFIKGAEACYGDVLYFNKQGKVLRYWKSGPYKPWKFYLGWMPPHPTFFVKRTLYERYGTFDLRFSIAADYELMLRFCLKYGVRPYYIPRVLVFMSAGGTSNSSLKNILLANLEVLKAWKKNKLPLSFMGYFVPLFKPSGKLLQFIRRPNNFNQISLEVKR